MNDGDDNRRFTISQSASGEGRFIRKSGARGQYGHGVVRIDPGHPGTGVATLNELPDERIPKEFIDAVYFGIKEGLKCGVQGRPVVRVTGGSSNPTDSSDLAYKMAGIFAVKEALKAAKPVEI